MESHGAVFLPAAGYRNGTSVNYAGSYGYYWSSASYDHDYAGYLHFCSDDLYTGNSGSRRGSGRSVRLVQNVK